MVYMGYKFRAPKRSEIKEWKRIREGVENGTDWTTKTIRKEEKTEAPRLSPMMREALGTTKKTKT